MKCDCHYKLRQLLFEEEIIQVHGLQDDDDETEIYCIGCTSKGRPSRTTLLNTKAHIYVMK
jgi:hypothetical protein